MTVDEQGNEVEVKADPKRPYKAFAVMAVVMITTLLSQPLDFNPWVKAIGFSVVAGLTVYITPNPIAAYLKQRN